MIRRPPRSPLFPSTTLFRSHVRARQRFARIEQRVEDAELVPAAAAQSGLRAEAVLEARSEEHTSELQSHLNLVCRLLLEKKKTINSPHRTTTMSANTSSPAT